MIVAFSISPGRTDEHGGVAGPVAEMVRAVRDSGLPNETNAMFTNIEGDWDEVMAVVKRCVEIAGADSSRVGLVLKADIRPGHSGEMSGKVERVEAHLREQSRGRSPREGLVSGGSRGAEPTVCA